MAAIVHDDILMDTALAGVLPASSWYVIHEAHREYNYAAVQSERGITGKLHIHRVLELGSVKQWRDYPYTLICTHEEYRNLRTLLGKVVYFMPHYRDEGDVATYRHVVLFQSMVEEAPYNPVLEYWRVGIRLIDAEGNAIG